MTPIRTIHAIPIKAKRDLIAAGVLTVEQAGAMTDASLLRLPAIGRVAINAIRRAALVKATP